MKKFFYILFFIISFFIIKNNVLAYDYIDIDFSGNGLTYSTLEGENGDFNKVKIKNTGTTKYGFFSTRILPAGFSVDATVAPYNDEEFRKKYIVDKICNGSYYFPYSKSGDFELDKDDLEGNTTNADFRTSKALILCSGDNANVIVYNNNLKDLAITTNDSPNNTLNSNYGYAIYSSNINNTYVLTNVSSGNSFSCPSSLSSYDRITEEKGNIEINNGGTKYISICLAQGNGSSITKGPILLKKKVIIDTTKPTIKFSNNFDENKWYTTGTSEKITCEDNKYLIDECNIIYNNESKDEGVLFLVNKEGEHSIKVYAENEIGNISTVTKTYKLDSTKPTLFVSYKSNSTSDGQKVESVTVTLNCLDSGSGCKTLNKSGWSAQGNNTYEKTFTSNNHSHPETINLADKAGNEQTIEVKVEKVGTSLTGWYGDHEINIVGNITKCDDDGEEDSVKYKFSAPSCVGSECKENDYPLDGAKYYYAEHREVGIIGNNLKCQYRDSTPPTFTNKNQIRYATNNFNFKLEGLQDKGGSGIKKIYVKLIDENLGTYEKTKDNITSSNITLNFGNKFKNINNLDKNKDGVAEIIVEGYIEDWAGNRTDIEPSNNKLLIIPGKIDVNKSIKKVFGSNATKCGSDCLVADSDGIVKYEVELHDQYDNIIKPIKYNGQQIRKIKTNIEFNNTLKYYKGSSDNPVFYKWPGKTFFSNSLNYFNNTFYNSDDHDYSVSLYSLVPSKEQYNLATGDIYLEEFKVTDDFYLRGYYNPDNIDDYPKDLKSASTTITGKLKFQPPVEIKLEPGFNGGMVDNIEYLFNVKIKKNTKQNVKIDKVHVKVGYGINDLNITKRFVFKDGDSYDYFNIIKTILFSNNGNFDGDLKNTNQSSYLPYNYGGWKNYPLLILGDSAGEGFGDLSFGGWLPYDGITVGGNHTSYQVNGDAGSITGLKRTIDITGLVGNSKDKGTYLLTKGGAKNVVIDNKGVYKAEVFRTIKQNIARITKNLKPKMPTNDDSLNFGSSFSNSDGKFLNNKGEKIYYYDFKDCTNSDPINGNKGCLLKINGEVSGKNILIVKGGNILVIDNVYYKDDNSILAIVVLRDKNDLMKGGNILVKDNVTNIESSIFAQGSIMSVKYNSIAGKYEIFNIANSSNNELLNQLLFYGSILSANNIGGTATFMQDRNMDTSKLCPYNSDYYMSRGNGKKCTYDEIIKYDLANLRRYNPILAHAPTYYTFSKAGDGGGKTTLHNGSVVIEYNPNIVRLGLSVFEAIK